MKSYMRMFSSTRVPFPLFGIESVVISGYLILIWGKKLYEYKITRKLRKEEREGSSVQKPFQDGNKYTCSNPQSLKFKDQKKPAKFIGKLLLE